MIPVNEPIISERTQRYVLDCLKNGWISSQGSYITEFEKQFAHYVGCRYAVTTTSGTAALHLALAAAGIGAGDEILIPNLTIISCAYAALYTGAKPVLVDVDASSATIDPKKIEYAITQKTKAIMPVHLYGNAANMSAILKIAKKNNLLVIEDAAEALAVEYKEKKVGSIGDIGIFSFYANKLITTGEGGMLVTNNPQIYEKALSMKNLSHSKHARFLHEDIGFTYRMTNIQAAIGLAQLEDIEAHIQKKKHIYTMYTTILNKLPYIEIPPIHINGTSLLWMFTLLVAKDAPFTRADLMKYLYEHHIETRTYFYPLHTQPVLQARYTYTDDFQVSTDLAQRGFYIPSGLAITDEQISAVGKAIQTFCTQYNHG